MDSLKHDYLNCLQFKKIVKIALPRGMTSTNVVNNSGKSNFGKRNSLCSRIMVMTI